MFQLSIAALQTTATLSGLKQPFHCISQFCGSDIWAKLGGIILLLHMASAEVSQYSSGGWAGLKGPRWLSLL